MWWWRPLLLIIVVMSPIESANSPVDSETRQKKDFLGKLPIINKLPGPYQSRFMKIMANRPVVSETRQKEDALGKLPIINKLPGPYQRRFMKSMANTSKIASTEQDFNRKLKHHAMKELVGSCPYCGPNYSDIPNLLEAVRGYDMAHGNPFPGHGRFDPGIRSRIFHPMMFDHDNYRNVNGKFVSLNSMLSCDTSWKESVFHNFQDYIQDRTRSALAGYGLRTNEEVLVPVTTPNMMGQVFMKLPPLYTGQLETNKELKALKFFLDEQNGTVAVSEAKCLMDRVDISPHSPFKKFSNMFLDAAVQLTKAADETPVQQDRIFRDFVKEFGTHFSKNTWMGVKVYAERRYTQKETKRANETTLMRCNSLYGQLFTGVNLADNSTDCNNTQSTGDSKQSETVERNVIYTYGSFAPTSDPKGIPRKMTLSPSSNHPLFQLYTNQTSVNQLCT